MKFKNGKTVKELAEKYDRHPQTVLTWTRKYISAYESTGIRKIGNYWVVPDEEITEFERFAHLEGKSEEVDPELYELTSSIAELTGTHPNSIVKSLRRAEIKVVSINRRNYAAKGIALTYWKKRRLSGK